MHLQMEIHLFGANKFHILTDKEFIFRNGLLKEHVLYLCADHSCFLKEWA